MRHFVFQPSFSLGAVHEKNGNLRYLVFDVLQSDVEDTGSGVVYVVEEPDADFTAVSYRGALYAGVVWVMRDVGGE